MLERETKREKILEARQRELRLKERSRSEQSREEEVGLEDGNHAPDQLIAKAESDFYSVVEVELRKRRDQEDLNHQVRLLPHPLIFFPLSSDSLLTPPPSSDFSLWPLTPPAGCVDQLTEALVVFQEKEVSEEKEVEETSSSL